jgi:hypothetical protein
MRAICVRLTLKNHHFHHILKLLKHKVNRKHIKMYIFQKKYLELDKKAKTEVKFEVSR